MVAAYAEPLTEQACRTARFSAFDAEPGSGHVPFPHAPQAISQSSTAHGMTIVAIGSSSTEGITRNARNRIYPAAMQAALSRLWPKADVKVVNKGKGGETMRETIARFETDVFALKPSLVIWQLGVNDVLAYKGLEGRHEEIQAGLKIFNARGIPVILLDLQYAPMVIDDPDTLPMQALIDKAAHSGPRGRVFHFKRFALMKQLAERHNIPDAEMTDQDGLHMTDAMHGCVGMLLAEMVVSAGTITIGERQ
ncbi:MAG: SGNH/GDSL hydrolase family protein [Beijerinckiaceae bacterium]